MGIFTIDITAYVNQPPSSVGNNSVSVAHAATYVFTQANFTTETSPAYADPDGDIPENVKILTLPATGTLQYNGSSVTVNQEVPYTGIGLNLLDYVADAGTEAAYVDTFTFEISDVGSSTFTGTGTFTLNVDSKVNQPPTSGDITVGIAHAETLILTRAMFTTSTTPAYSDPEGDAESSVRVESLPANGNLRYNGTNVTLNQVITFTDIDANLFTYVADPTFITLRQVTFDFTVSDTGSGQFG